MAENHRKDLLNLHQQLQEDARTEKDIQREAWKKELHELRELLFNQTSGGRSTPRVSKPSPRPVPLQPSPRSSQFTALKAPVKPQVRPAGILKRPGPTEPPDLISFSPTPDKMEIEGVLADSMWAPGETHPERIPQVLVVSPVQSPKRQGRVVEREGRPEVPKRQEPSAARGGSEAELPTGQGASEEREGDCQASTRQEPGAEREGDCQASTRQKPGAEREGSMVDVQTQTQRLGRSRSRGRRFNRSRTPLPPGPISARASPVPRTYAAVAAQVATPNPNLSGTNRTPLAQETYVPP
jgi:hypothetical protein